LGKKKHIDKDDTIPLASDISILKESRLYSDINWGSTRDLLQSIFWKMRKPLLFNLLLLAGAQGISLFSPILIHQFIDGLTKGIHTERDFFSIAAVGLSIGLLGYISGLFMQHYFHQNLKLQQKLNSITNAKIFDQSLKLSHSTRQNISVGDVVNYMSSDSESIADMCFVFLELTIDLIMIVASVGLLYYYLGTTALVSILVLLLLIPITNKVANQFTKLDDEIMKFRDERLNLMGQILNAIRLIKYFVWEKSVETEVLAIRNKEVEARKQVVKADSISNVIYMAISTLVLLITLIAHSMRGEEVNLAVIFTVLSIFTLLEEPFGNLTSLISRCANGIVGAKRISEFASLSTSEINRYPLEQVAIETNNLSFAYNQQFALKNLNIKMTNGQALAVVGSVGSGKSTLLQILLRELPPQGGSLIYLDQKGLTLDKQLPDSTVFVPQESYIINASLKENLLFGSNELTETDLKKAVYLACLDEDLQNLQYGLGTEIGEKGVNLSGGQKQRVSLARAILKNPKLILLDDPLAAVDVHTENILCERLIFGEWKNKTRVVVTHRLEHLSKFDQILLLKDGVPVAYGPYSDLLIYSREFHDFYKNYQKSGIVNQLQNIKADDSNSNQNPKDKPSLATTGLANSPAQSSHRVTEDEEKAVGAINKSLYFSYLKLLGGEKAYRKWILSGLALSALISKLFPLLQKTWLSQVTKFDMSDINWFFAGYSLLGCTTLGLSYFNNQLWFNQGIKAAVETHNKMLRSVLHTNIRFFDATPVGRILQRFSRDQESIDVHLMFTHITAIDCFVQILISLILIVATLPIMLVFIAPVLLFYYWIQNDYRRVAREVKRLDSIARSPRYAHFKETLQGLTVLRAFGSQSWFREEFWDRLHFSHQMYYNHYMVNRWFSVRVPFIGGIVGSSTAVLLTWASHKGVLTPGVCGLVLVYAMSFWRHLNWAVRIFSDIESRMTSIERLQFLCELPQEQDFMQITSNKDGNHPQPKINLDSEIQSGNLEFENLSVRYAKHLPLVLNDISFKVAAGERVGIIGRTGSGKSTLFQALYRFVEFESGDIKIGGVSIQQISLPKLRRALAIIPQDPTLFLGTLRSNLDRYNEYTDTEIEAVLQKACLWNFINSLPMGLNSRVIENGNNFSQGQRQLLCLARALLIRAKIIILDEATASVDIQTDNLIQRILNEELKGITLLIIAHRLETIKNCDQIIKLNQGRMKKVQGASLNRKFERPKEINL
jgi:ABC-type multidrug transport system fused ATPase/permease subunit